MPGEGSFLGHRILMSSCGGGSWDLSGVSFLRH